ncbi:MAG: hypothetical protein HYZ57_01745 [Acidobacteria bacterium]|nr:hypothetical protein [Acidobacteriota bacterium]
MRKLLVMLAGALFLASIPAWGDRDPNTPRVPIMRQVEPGKVKPGDLINVMGENLDTARVAQVLLYDGKTHLKMKVLKQTEAEVQCRIPDNAKPGRYSIVVLLTDADPTYLEEPVKLTVE